MKRAQSRLEMLDFGKAIKFANKVLALSCEDCQRHQQSRVQAHLILARAYGNFRLPGCLAPHWGQAQEHLFLASGEQAKGWHGVFPMGKTTKRRV